MKPNLLREIFDKIVNFVKSDLVCKRKLREAEAKIRLMENAGKLTQEDVK